MTTIHAGGGYKHDTGGTQSTDYGAITQWGWWKPNYQHVVKKRKSSHSISISKVEVQIQIFCNWNRVIFFYNMRERGGEVDIILPPPSPPSNCSIAARKKDITVVVQDPESSWICDLVYNQETMILVAVLLLLAGHSVSSFTLPRQVDEPFGGLLQTLVQYPLPCS